MNTAGLEFDPYDYYKKMLKEDVKQRSEALIEELTKKANTDIALNQKLSKEVEDLAAKINDNTGKRTGHKVLSYIVLALGIIALIVAICSLMFIVNGDHSTTYILGLIIGALVFVGCLLLYFLVIRKKIKAYDKTLAKLKESHQKKINEAWNSLDSLRQNLNYKQFVDFVNNLNTTIKLDYEVDEKKVRILREHYNVDWEFSKSEAVVDCYSGTICNNPFIRVLISRQQMRNHVYTGSRVVTWTERVRDSNGRVHNVTKSQTLVANYTAPAPFYDTYSMIMYGNGAAPKLSFSRNPSGLKKDDDEKDVKKLVKDRYKDVCDYAEKAIAKGKNFTALANEEFEALFYALDRDNETEFRLLFTPLAQQNMLELIKAQDTYGDDFSFVKRKKMNYIVSYHSMNSVGFNYLKFNNYYSYEKFKTDYITDLNSAFFSLYFDLAPILAIPLYQMDEAPFYEGEIDEEITNYEAETFVNGMDHNLFKHPLTKTKQILKVNRSNRFKDVDTFKVASYSFDQLPQTAVVSVACMNGRVYDVPVHWFRYDPLENFTNVAISRIKKDRENGSSPNFNYQNYRYHNYISAFLGNDEFDANLADTFANYVKINYNLM